MVIPSALILQVIQSELSGYSQRWPLLWIQSALVPLVDSTRAGPYIKSNQCWPRGQLCQCQSLVVQLVPLVDLVTAGPISRCSHSLSHQWLQLQLVPLANLATDGPLGDAIKSIPLYCKSVIFCPWGFSVY